MKEMSTMEARLQKWGNSNGIRIPNNILKTLDIKTNDPVELTVQDSQTIIKKSIKNKEISLKEKFAKYKGPNLAKDFTWDEPKGNELW